MVGADGQVSKAEQGFLRSVVRPRALADEVATGLADKDAGGLAARASTLLERAKELHARTRVSMIKVMIQAAKADRKIEEAEIRAIHTAARDLAIEELGFRELRSAFGSRVDFLAR